MEKTRLGISVSLMVGILYFFGIYGGYTITGIAVGYVLLKEDNNWLKKQSLRVLLLMVLFSLLGTAVGIIPSILGVFSNILEVFDVYYYFNFFRNVFAVLDSVLSVLRIVAFAGLGVLAVFRKEVKLPIVDSIIDKYMD